MLGNSIGIVNLWTYLAGVVVVILLPGPNSLYVLSVAAQRGVRHGYAGACGVFLGDTILMTLAAAGVASLLHAQPALFFVVKYLGAAYLCWMGLNMLRGALADARAARAGEGAAVAAPKQVDADHPFKRALFISLLNPKAILFCVSFFIQFVDPGYAYPAVSFAVLGVIVQTCSFLYLSTLILAGYRLAEHFRQRRRLSAGATGGVGALFVGFGVKLATATLS
ncbi:leucine efflux protein LeuE [Pandoraea apista]|uniref:Leucine efflux protein LeuE n=1 Tax=Pandoraea apista TaxID=93218 RepID=A0A0B5F139_9BURK|nr:leucine efflux protein LeuE [Pandoraea apista]AJE97030.1 membrane protein [Pandoraea apista]AKH70978.1 membrane protein [Pandoraea apista]AKI63250.1 membrane protein [Pandoraea apista]ALS67655.1 leucine efflux protein LeuE [Pandoraea apista]AVF41600.1 leucine efflux protein LeuE [Pandoraea apista]